MPQFNLSKKEMFCHLLHIILIVAGITVLALGHEDTALLGGWDSVAPSYEKRRHYKQILSRYQLPPLQLTEPTLVVRSSTGPVHSEV